MEELHRFHAEQYGERNGNSEEGGSPFQRLPKRFDRIETDDVPLDNNDRTLMSSTFQSSIRKLEEMGCQVFLPAQSAGDSNLPGWKSIDWGQLAGYDDQKRAIEDCLLLPLLRPEVYDSVARGTREKFQPNRPRAVLFVGPPGTGKTTSARVIASQASVPMVYIPMEALVSKWYGESEKHLAAAFKAAESFPHGCIVFLDELDSLATTRGGEMHEATRRVLGVLLRHMDGFDTSKRSVVVGATNRPQDLDPALRNRFSALVAFELPGESCRRAILRKYAHHLGETEIAALAMATPGMAGRDLRDVCEQAERRWAAAIVRGQASEQELPSLQMYMDAANARLVEMSKGRGDV
jgi:SpoVK/Ycf46/Vps4 family AAA+-type ATPase